MLNSLLTKIYSAVSGLFPKPTLLDRSEELYRQQEEIEKEKKFYNGGDTSGK